MERAAYRIIDANFNRAREAARVIEEFCRFSLNSAPLSERAKRLRHELSACLSKLDTGRLLSSRDTPGDIGAGKTIDKQIERTDLKSCFTANCKRLTEALRTLNEMMQTTRYSILDTGYSTSIEKRASRNEMAQIIEKLRFDAYALEKDIVLFSEPAEKFKRVRLYVIISSNLPVDIIRLTQASVAGGADCIQLRAKPGEAGSGLRPPSAVNDDKLFAVAVEFVQICKEAGVLGIINDRMDIAVAAGADGVHLGQNDLSVGQARKLQLSPMIIGISTHSLEQLKTSCEAFPTYVGLGPVYATGTKPTAEPVGLDYIRHGTKQLADTGIGHVAIGGITLNNVEKVLKAGAKAIAVCAATTEAEDPTAACRALKQKIAAFK